MRCSAGLSSGNGQRRVQSLGNGLLGERLLKGAFSLANRRAQHLADVAAHGALLVGLAAVQGEQVAAFHGLIHIEQGDRPWRAQQPPTAADAGLRPNKRRAMQLPEDAPDEDRVGVDAPRQALRREHLTFALCEQRQYVDRQSKLSVRVHVSPRSRLLQARYL